MRYADPLIYFSWRKQPEALVGPAYAIARDARPLVDAVRVPYPFHTAPPYPFPTTTYRPLDCDGPRLFEAVAGLDTSTASAVESFARNWGLLNNPELLSLDPSGAGPVAWAGQELEAWRVSIDELREARELWRAISQNDAAAIGKLVRVDKRPVPRQPGGTERSVAVAVYQGTVGFAVNPLPRPNLPDAARVSLAWIFTQRMQTALGCGYDRNAPRKLRTVARPLDLLAAAWAQLEQHATRNAAIACERCGEIFVVRLGDGGRRREYHNNNCKAALGRKRRAKARTRRDRDA